MDTISAVILVARIVMDLSNKMINKCTFIVNLTLGISVVDLEEMQIVSNILRIDYWKGHIYPVINTSRCVLL